MSAELCTPVSPATKRVHMLSILVPKGVIAPKPVTTTRREEKGTHEEEGEEEQEKRALDSPNGNREFFGFEDEKDGDEDADK